MRRPEQARIALAIPGGVPERLNGAVSKTVVRASVPRVRIPPPPLLWLGRSQFAASRAQFNERRDVSRPLQRRQRTSAHVDNRLRCWYFIPPPFPGRPREHEAGGPRYGAGNSFCHAEGRGFESLQPLRERRAFAGLFIWLADAGCGGRVPRRIFPGRRGPAVTASG
jgi:hypothetical protein